MYYNKKKNLAKKKDEAKEEAKEKKDTKKIIEDEIPRQLGDYQLMEAIGRGGFGTVYRGISVVSGQTVAVKRVGLHGIPQEELESIEMEIRLLQNLVHANIVKYLDSIRTQEHLNIILEYVENGSLSALLSKFPNSRMPESLVCHYVAQVLKGLHYLHTQGVIHRDIKGANILSTKDGLVKLADFGVATKISESRKSDSVVGTPYWMAPEIIEMTGQQSSACDIWSVGCTAIELFTGKPPYFDLQQMPALFRIVQDEHPPLPDNISPAMESFLLECFQKDPNRRIDAHGLLRHQWLKNVVGLSDEIEHEAAAAAAVAASASAMRKSTASSPPTIETPTIHDSDTEENWDEEIAEEEAAAASTASATASPAMISPLSPSSARGPPPTIIKKTNHSSSLSSNHHHVHKLVETEEQVFDAFEEIEEPAESVSELKSKSSIKTTDKLKGATHAVVFAERLRSKTGIGAELTGTTNMMRPGGTKKLEEFQEDEENEQDEWELDDVAIDVNKLEDRKEPHHTALDVADDFNEVDEDDPFNDITFEEDRTVDEDIQVSKAFLRVIAQLTPKNDEKIVLEACDTLNEMGAKNPEQMRSLMTAHGVIPIMEMLEITNPNILHAVLKVVNQIVGKNHSFQQSMSLVGLIPAIIRFASGNFPAEIRLEAANFVRQFCYASDFTRKMFIACDGLPVLVGFLQEEYFQSKTLVWNAIDCIRHVFDITSNPKNDFCRLFCKFGLLPPLTRTLELVNADKDSDVAQEYVLKIAKILHLFSQGDPVVKTHFAKPEVIENMLHVLPSLPQEVLILVLKSIRNISMDPMTLDLLEAAGAIPALVPFLSSPYPENQHQVLLTMYYLCQIKPSRQEQAALSGVIPHLQRFVRENHPLKQFAFPIIFLLAKTSNRSRLELKKYAGVQFYLDVLEDVYWRTHALEVLAAWLQEDPVKVGFILNTSSNINKLLTVFRTTTKTVQFEKMLPLFRKMLSCSIRVNQAFGRSHMFIMEIKHRLEKHTHSNSIRINLLKILALVFVAHQSSSRLIKDHDLLPVLIRLSEEKSSVIVMSLAQKLVEKFKNTTTLPIQTNMQQPQQAIVAH